MHDNIVWMRCTPFCFFLAVSALVAGCGGSGATQSETTSSPPASIADKNLSHDVGRVIAGTPVSYDFLVENSSDEPMTILADTDIRLNCGCSSLVPANRRIEPKSQTTIKVKVETQGKRGPFAHGGTIVWTGDSGAKWPISLVLRGEAIPPIECTPEVVRFDTEETRSGKEKEFLLTANVPVSWDSLKWSSSSSHVKVLQSRAEGHSVRCKVKCELPEGQETLQGALTAYVEMNETSSALSKTITSFTVPISAEQAVELVVMPKMARIVFRNGERRGTTRLLLHGELLNRTESIVRRIRCDGFRVSWTMSKPTPSKKAVLEVAFESDDKGSVSDPKLRIELVTGKSIVLPTALVWSKVDHN